MNPRYINLVQGVPVAGDFSDPLFNPAASGGMVSPLCVNALTGAAYTLAGGVVTSIAGGGTAYVDVADFGAIGDGVANDRPAIQAAITYAAANGILEVRLMARHASWQPAFPGGTPDHTLGAHLRIQGDVALVGAPTTITLKNPTGGARTKTDGTNLWWSGWLVYYGTAVTTSILRDITVDGTITFTNPLVNTESNIYDKGIFYNDGAVPNLVKIDHRDCTLKSFGGEIWYMGGSFTTCKIYVENLKLSNSPQCCWNPGALAKVVAVNLDCENSYQLAETIGGQGHIYIGGRFALGSTSTFMNTAAFAGGTFPYWFPTRDAALPPPWCTFIGTRFEKAGIVNLTSWTRGKIMTLDCTVQMGQYCDRDVDLEIEAWCDGSNGSAAVNFYGPSSLTQTLPGMTGANYYTPAQSIRLKVQVNRTLIAATATRSMDGIRFMGGLVDNISSSFEVGGSVRYAWQITSPVAGFTLPLIKLNDCVVNNSVGPGGSGANTIAPTIGGTTTVQVSQGSYMVAAGSAGTATIAIGNTYTYTHGQRVQFWQWNNAGDRLIKFPAGGTGLGLAQDRILYNFGDMIELEYNSVAAKWEEVRYQTSKQIVFAGSATYDAPSIANGAQTTTTVTATGAALGDYVDRISLGIDAAGLQLSGYVSAANTVTVVLKNDTGSAVNLASTTLAVEVRKKQ